MSDQAVFAPPPEFAASAHVGSLEAYQDLCRRAEENPEQFWSELAEKEILWYEKWSHAFEWHPPFVKWFVDGKTNASANCLDRHVEAGKGDKVALLWEGEPGDTRRITYAEMLAEVCRFANGLKQLGLQPGDRAVIYMPMVPEAVVAMLGCARIGVTHSVVFGGFSAEALKARIQDLEAQIVITADGGWRRGKEVKLKPAVDEALADCPTVRHSVVYQRTNSALPMQEGRDIWWHDFIKDQPAECPPEKLDAEHPLFVLYTSGTTGKPKGILHTTGGYLLHARLTMKWVFDLKDDDIYWCSADIGWVTGHTYIVYGPMSAGATQIMYEGAPDHPGWDRWWAIAANYKATIFYTSPTAVRAIIKQGDALPAKHDLSSLRLLGSVGEPINPAAWEWYHRVIGGGRCPIVDTWWQTETGGILIAPMPGAIALKPGSGTLPMPGIQAEVVDFDGNPVGVDQEGFLIIKRPWPSMIRNIWGDPQRFEQQYFSRIPGIYFTGDAARRDAEGYFWILGRVDDVMNVSGHRLSTMEVESALVRHRAVAEAAVVGKPDEITGQAVCCFVTLKEGNWNHDTLGQELRQWVAHEIGSFARPAEIRFAEALPKTRSGKIMRRLLREIVTSHTVSGDVTTLEDLGVVKRLAAQHDDD